MKKKLTLVAFGILLFASCKNGDSGKRLVSMQPGKDYPVYGGNKAGNRYSPLSQVNIDNVKNLQVAWTYFANDKPDTANGKEIRAREIQCQPIVVNSVL